MKGAGQVVEVRCGACGSDLARGPALLIAVVAIGLRLLRASMACPRCGGEGTTRGDAAEELN